VDDWLLLDATEAERARFPDLRSVLAHPGTAAAPRNRWREVRCLEVEGTRYYLKLFHRTQLKNRIKHRLRAPRCRSDAEREWLIARALRQRGFGTARPVALGRRGALSCYLCAEVPGQTVRDLLAAGRLDGARRRAAARFAGSIGAAGIVLPDLSADHVIADGAALSVIDLHNGRLGRVRAADAVRMLRHLQRSVRGLPIAPAHALRAAVLMLRGIGFHREARALLERLPPLATHARYESEQRSAAYRRRDPRRDRRELACLRRVWPGAPGDLVLDVPCGTGRVSSWVQRATGARAVGADRALAMLRAARREPDAPPLLMQADAASLPFADRSCAGVVVFRFLHHQDRHAARATVREAARVAARYVVVSFFHPVSLHGARRRFASLWKRRDSARHTVSPRRLSRWLAEAGFTPVRWSAELPYARELWVASFERR
jgi:SAM-dependent methyltransferase